MQPARCDVRAFLRLKGATQIKKPNYKLANQIFGVGQYAYKNGQLYFVHGKTRIKVTEHFPSAGNAMDLLLEDLIQFSAQRKDDEIQRTVWE
jgi:hypothetical protein